MTRYHTTGRNHWQPRQPSGLTREQINGPLYGSEQRLSWTARFCYAVGAAAIALGAYHWQWSAF